MTQARDQNNNYDKPKALKGKIAYAKCLEKIKLKHVLFWFGIVCCWEPAKEHLFTCLERVLDDTVERVF